MKHGYGGAYHGGAKNNTGISSIQAKTGVNAEVLNRGLGYARTEVAMSSKKGSMYPASSKHYQYEDAGSGTGGNNIGWMPV